MNFILTASFLVLSGIASLTYQVTWVRLLGLSMGSTSASISTVLAAFFLGMALGSYLAEKITRNRINSLTPYIILELLIGVSGLLLLPILLHLDSLMAILPAIGTEISLKFAATLLLLSIPTMCMGATFPVMASILIRNKNEIGLRISQLYSLNTAGAVLGAFLTGFVLIPNWGLDGAIYIAFSLNMIIAIVAIYANKKFTRTITTNNKDKEDEYLEVDEAHNKDRTKAIIVLAATGFISIATQVGWTKYLSVFTGTTIYGFSAILTVFLSGITAGSWAIKNHLEKIRNPQLWMSVGLLLLGSSLILTRVGFSLIPDIYEYLNHYTSVQSLNNITKYLIIFLMLFIPTFILGALFPLNLKLYCGTLKAVRTRVGKAYSINTVASIFGAIFAGFFFIPEYGTDALLTIMASGTLLLSMLFLGSITELNKKIAISVSVAAALILAIQTPHLNYKELIASIGYQWDDDVISGKKPEFIFIKEGKAGIVSLVTYDKTIAKLQSNGLNESLIHMSDQNKTMLTESLLGIIPYILHENPKSAFVVGFGGGTTTRALTLTDIESIRVVELEPAVIEADRQLYTSEIPALKDPRVKINFNDARNTLLIENKTYDLIVAQPSHPWLAGAANVFTRQFWELTKSRLNKGGVFGQWVNLFKMDVTTLQSLFQAFYNVYPYGLSFANLHTGDLILIGSTQPITFDYDRISKILSQDKIKNTLSIHDIHEPADLLWYFALSRDEALSASAGSPSNTDTNIISEVRLSALTKQPDGKEDPYQFLRDNFKLDLLPYLGEDAIDKLYLQANYYISWNDIDLAKKASNQLKTIAPVLARGIDYEIAWHDYDFKTAINLYNKYQEWPDRTHKQHALLLTKNGQLDSAFESLDNIKDDSIKDETYAQILYRTNNIQTLYSLPSENDEYKKWKLLDISKNDIEVAGDYLRKITLSSPNDIPQMITLLKYYKQSSKFSAHSKEIESLSKTLNSEKERLENIVKKGIPKEDTMRINALSKAIEEIREAVPHISNEPPLHTNNMPPSEYKKPT